MKYILESSHDLKECYGVARDYHDFNLTSSMKSCREDLEELIEKFARCKNEGFKEIASTLTNWKEEIINSFIEIYDYEGNLRRLSNGPIEGINSSIKKIFLCGNGYVSFDRFRRRCMYSINKDIAIQMKPKKLDKNK